MAACIQYTALVLLLLGCIYLVVGAFTLRNFERLARAQATLSLT